MGKEKILKGGNIMRVGIDNFTIRELGLNRYGELDYVHSSGLDGVQFGGIRSLSESLDTGELKALRQYADEKNLYTETGVSCVNPLTAKCSFDELKTSIEAEIAAAASAGWNELHSVINCGTERYTHSVPWNIHVSECIKLINQLRPTLERYGSRINIETHGETTFDVLRVIECTGEHLVGCCLDTANTFVNGEDPVLAAKRVAPYTHLTHTKDAIVTFCDDGIVRQGRPPGSGNVDFATIIPIIGACCPHLPLSIEDHKWLFTLKIYNAEWIAKNPDLTPYELGQVVRHAWNTHKKITAGIIPCIEDYEKTPYKDEMESRLSAGRDYLKKLLRECNLYADSQP